MQLGIVLILNVLISTQLAALDTRLSRLKELQMTNSNIVNRELVLSNVPVELCYTVKIIALVIRVL